MKETANFYRTIDGKEYHLNKNCNKINKTDTFKIDEKSAGLLFSCCEACKKHKNQEAYFKSKAKANKGIHSETDFYSLFGKNNITIKNFHKNKENKLFTNFSGLCNNYNNNKDLSGDNVDSQEINNCSLNKKENEDLQFDKNFEEKVKQISNPLLNAVNELKIKEMQIEHKLNFFEIEELKREKEFETKMILLEYLSDDLKMFGTKLESVSEKCFSNEKLFDAIDFKFIELENKVIDIVAKRESELENKLINLLDIKKSIKTRLSIITVETCAIEHWPKNLTIK